MDHKNVPGDFWDQVYQFGVKYGTWIGWWIMGLMGQFSYNLIRNKSMTYSYMLGCTGTSLFVGYVGGSWILTNYPEKASIFIPMLTLLSNNIISALMVIDWKAIMAKDWKGAFDILMRRKS